MANSETLVTSIWKMLGSVKPESDCIAKSILPPECSLGDPLCRPKVLFLES